MTDFMECRPRSRPRTEEGALAIWIQYKEQSNCGGFRKPEIEFSEIRIYFSRG